MKYKYLLSRLALSVLVLMMVMNVQGFRVEAEGKVNYDNLSKHNERPHIGSPDFELDVDEKYTAEEEEKIRDNYYWIAEIKKMADNYIDQSRKDDYSPKGYAEFEKTYAKIEEFKTNQDLLFDDELVQRFRIEMFEATMFGWRLEEELGEVLALVNELMNYDEFYVSGSTDELKVLIAEGELLMEPLSNGVMLEKETHDLINEIEDQLTILELDVSKSLDYSALPHLIMLEELQGLVDAALFDIGSFETYTEKTVQDVKVPLDYLNKILNGDVGKITLKVVEETATKFYDAYEALEKKADIFDRNSPDHQKLINEIKAQIDRVSKLKAVDYTKESYDNLQHNLKNLTMLLNDLEKNEFTLTLTDIQRGVDNLKDSESYLKAANTSDTQEKEENVSADPLETVETKATDKDEKTADKLPATGMEPGINYSMIGLLLLGFGSLINQIKKRFTQ